MKVLIIEDEELLRKGIVFNLKQEGFVVETALDYQSARSKINVYQYDCILVDLNLPGGSGLDLVHEIKSSSSNTGIIIISAKDNIDTKIEGLDRGSDDYLTKPFHMGELIARVRSVIRRRSYEGKTEIVFNEIKINPSSRTVFIHGKEIVLTVKEYDLLLFFLANKNKILSKEAIAEHLSGDKIDQADSFDFIYTHIKNLRKKLLENNCPDYLTTVYGVGYKFQAV